MAKKSARKGPDLTVTLLWGAIILIVVSMVSAVLYLVAAGLTGAHMPRTAVERQLQFAEAEIKANPKSALSWTNLIDAYDLAGQFSDAAKAFEKAKGSIGSTQSPAPLYVANARMLAHKGDADAALEAADEALEVGLKWRKKEQARLKELGIVATSPSMKEAGAAPIIDALGVKASIYRDQKKWDDVVSVSTRIIALNPLAADYLTLRGKAYVELNQVDKARADFKQAADYGFEQAKTELEKLEK